MLKANAEWSKSPDYTGALKASNYLGSINPNSNCYKEALELNTSISDRLKELDNREWAYQLKQQQDNVDLTKALIEAARDVGVAYGENQPKNITYNYVRWW